MNPDINITFPHGRLRVFVVDDGDGSEPEARCEVQLRCNGEQGGGGKLPRMRRDEVESLIAVLQLALPKMWSPTP